MKKVHVVLLRIVLQRGKYLMVRVPTDHEYGLWKVALESQTADNVKATYVRPAPASKPNLKKVLQQTDLSLTVTVGVRVDTKATVHDGKIGTHFNFYCNCLNTL